MEPYAIALFAHLFCVLLATAASAIAFQSALTLRSAAGLAEMQNALANIRRVVPAFPLATLGLLASGGYMTHSAWTWSTPWILASIAGLALIVILGSVVEGSRLRVLGAELAANGLSDNARDLARDPVAWTAKLATIALLFGTVMEMTLKPGMIDAVAILLCALLAAIPLALPFWRAPRNTPARLSQHNS